MRNNRTKVGGYGTNVLCGSNGYYELGTGERGREALGDRVIQ